MVLAAERDAAAPLAIGRGFHGSPFFSHKATQDIARQRRNQSCALFKNQRLSNQERILKAKIAEKAGGSTGRPALQASRTPLLRVARRAVR
jgi:hypothetical protein